MACCQFGQRIYESRIPKQLQNPRNYRWKGTVKDHLNSYAKAGLFSAVNSPEFCPDRFWKAVIWYSQLVLGNIVFHDTSVYAVINLWKSMYSHHTCMYHMDVSFFIAFQKKKNCFPILKNFSHSHYWFLELQWYLETRALEYMNTKMIIFLEYFKDCVSELELVSISPFFSSQYNVDIRTRNSQKIRVDGGERSGHLLLQPLPGW